MNPIESQPPWMKSGSQSRDTDLMAYRDKWKLGGWDGSRPSISSYHLPAWCEACCGTIDLRNDDNWCSTSILWTDLILTELLSDPSKQVIPESMKSATYTFHVSPDQRAKCSILIQPMLAHDFENGTSLTGWLSFAGNNESYLFLIGLRCTHCAFEDLHNAGHVSFEVGVFVCFETITTYFIAQSNLTYFLFISTFTCLIDRLHVHLLWDLQARRYCLVQWRHLVKPDQVWWL